MMIYTMLHGEYVCVCFAIVLDSIELKSHTHAQKHTANSRNNVMQTANILCDSLIWYRIEFIGNICDKNDDEEDGDRSKKVRRRKVKYARDVQPNTAIR